MLRTRILTALALLAVLLPTLFVAPAWLFAAVLGVACAAGMWEWSRLAGVHGTAAVLIAIGWALAATALRSVDASGPEVFATASAAWLLLLATSLPRAALPVALGRRAVLVGLGALLLLAGWLALLRARADGAELLLSVLALAWVADVAAYFGGRALGGAKLAPRISPGKTWAGVYSAAVAVLVYGAVCAHWLPDTLAARLVRQWGWGGATLALLALLALSICGDLFESLLKRRAGVKDSSALLPGHGGVLDRVDALLPLLPAAMLMLR